MCVGTAKLQGVEKLRRTHYGTALMSEQNFDKVVILIMAIGEAFRMLPFPYGLPGLKHATNRLGDLHSFDYYV